MKLKWTAVLCLETGMTLWGLRSVSHGGAHRTNLKWFTVCLYHNTLKLVGIQSNHRSLLHCGRWPPAIHTSLHMLTSLHGNKGRLNSVPQRFQTG